MQALQGMVAKAIHEDRTREYAQPGRRHTAEIRLERGGGASALRTLFAATLARASRGGEGAIVTCTTPDGREGRLVARAEGGRRVFVCEVG
jgi:hypothetical protein